jgi:hypothetical protein
MAQLVTTVLPSEGWYARVTTPDGTPDTHVRLIGWALTEDDVTSARLVVGLVVQGTEVVFAPDLPTFVGYDHERWDTRAAPPVGPGERVAS